MNHGIVEEIKNFTQRVKHLRVAVIGETITDEFINVSYEGQSMKSICPVLKIEGKPERQMGGAAAIANHLKDFVKSVKLFSNDADEIIKTRYVDINDRKKHVEINKFFSGKVKHKKINFSNFDMVIVADFGHQYCNGLELQNGFHLMCQTNSNNFGFNRISKWKKYKKKSVCLDLREASLQINKKVHFSNKEEILELFSYELNAENIFLTTGAKGSIYSDGKKVIEQKSFPSKVIDTIGAGDAFFTFATLASHVKPKNLSTIMLVPALAASLSTTWLANEKSVTRKSLIEYADRFLQ